MAAADPIRQLLAAEIQQYVAIGTGTEPSRLLFPGAFNPLHQGHVEMARIAAELTGHPVEFEISIQNVMKPTLTEPEIRSRLEQFKNGETVRLTRSATFAQKAKLFPGATFIVGADTLQRIASPHFYGGSVREMELAVDTVADNRCRLLVFGRLIGEAFRSVESFDLGERLRRLCHEIPESQFRADVCSTSLRPE